MTKPSITVTIDPKVALIFTGLGAALGLVVSLLVGPVVSWLLDRIDSAPAVLRLIDLLPWSIPLLTVLGAVVGWLIFTHWNNDVGRVVVEPQQVRLDAKNFSAVYSRDEISEIFLDKDELVLLDDHAWELSRTTSEAGLAPKMAHAFTTLEYPWAGTKDPRDDAFTDWVDRSAELSEPIHALFRKRRRAIEDKRLGEAEELREEFTELLAGRQPETIIHQCGSGVSACHNLLAMEVAGLTGSRLYPGSWSEWTAHDDSPVAQGEE